MAQVGMAQVGTAQVGFAQVGIAQVGIAQVGMAQAGIAQVGMAQVGMAQAGIAQVGMAQVGMAQAGIAQVGTTQVGTTQVGTTQVGFCCNRSCSPEQECPRCIIPTSTGRSVSINSATHAAQVPSRAASLVGCGPARLANNGAAEHFVQRWAALVRVSIVIGVSPNCV